MPDAHKNFAISAVATAPSPATSGTSLVVATGEGALFPAPPFNAVVKPSGARAKSSNSEIVRVTAGPPGSDTFTITRAQEGSTARSIVIGDEIIAVITAKTLTDAENNAWDVVIRKAADESVVSSTTLQNDDDLFFTTVSGAFYEIELVLWYASPAGAGTPDFKYALGEDATARGIFTQAVFNSADAATISVFSANQAAGGTAGTAAANRGAWLRGTYVGNGGTFRLTWAQGTSNANATILRAGSLLRYRRIS